jgi:hypothetical protein
MAGGPIWERRHVPKGMHGKGWASDQAASMGRCYLEWRGSRFAAVARLHTVSNDQCELGKMVSDGWAGCER